MEGRFLPGVRAGRWPPNAQKPPPEQGLLQVNPGGDLLSQGAPPQVPSAQVGLTAVFEMGTGVSPPPWPPETYKNTALLEHCTASTNNEKTKPSAD